MRSGGRFFWQRPPRLGRVNLAEVELSGGPFDPPACVNRPQDFQHLLGVSLNDHEVCAVAAKRTRTALLPNTNLVDREAELCRKIILRYVEFLADASNIDFRRHMELARLRVAARDLEGLSETRCDLVECLFAHAVLPCCCLFSSVTL